MNEPPAESSADTLAERLLLQAIDNQQACLRVDVDTPVAAIRAEVRALARRRRVHIRTGLVDDALVVVRADADIWHESTQTMRTKLMPRD